MFRDGRKLAGQTVASIAALSVETGRSQIPNHFLAVPSDYTTQVNRISLETPLRKVRKADDQAINRISKIAATACTELGDRSLKNRSIPFLY
jgi:hypothetical protein